MLARIFPGMALRMSRYRDLMMIRLFGTATPPLSAPTADLPQVSQRRRRWSRRVTIAIAGVALLFYAWLVYQGVRTWDPSVLQTMRFDPGWVAAASLVQIVGYLWAVHLRQRTLAWLGYPLPFIEHQKIYAYSDLAAKLPGLFWGYASRIYLYNRFGIARSVAGVAIGLEIVATGVASSLVALAALIISPASETYVPIPVLIGALVGCAVMTNPRLLRFLLGRIANQPLAAALERLSWGAMLYIVACYAGIITMGGVCLLGIVSAVMGVRPELLIQMIETWSLTVVWGVLISWLPVEFGLRQGPLLVILSSIFPIPVAAVILLLWRIWVSAIELMWGAVAISVTLLLPSRAETELEP